MNLAKLSLFVSGLFFGGAIDHVILAVKGDSLTPYGVTVGVTGNWALAAIDLLLTVGLFWVHRRLDRR